MRALRFQSGCDEGCALALSGKERQARHKHTILRYLTEILANQRKMNEKLDKLANGMGESLANDGPLNGSLRKVSPTPPSKESPSLNTPTKSHSPFAEWWSVYPHKIGKGAAEKSYGKARKKGASEEELVEAVMRYVECKPDDRPWCNPATWLNQERWKDEYGQHKPNGHDVPESRGPPGPAPSVEDINRLRLEQALNGE